MISLRGLNQRVMHLEGRKDAAAMSPDRVAKAIQQAMGTGEFPDGPPELVDLCAGYIDFAAAIEFVQIGQTRREWELEHWGWSRVPPPETEDSSLTHENEPQTAQ